MCVFILSDMFLQRTLTNTVCFFILCLYLLMLYMCIYAQFLCLSFELPTCCLTAFVSCNNVYIFCNYTSAFIWPLFMHNVFFYLSSSSPCITFIGRECSVDSMPSNPACLHTLCSMVGNLKPLILKTETFCQYPETLQTKRDWNH